MKKLFALLVMALVSLSVVADNYVVYRVNHGTVPRLTKSGTEWTSTANQKVEFLVIFRVDTNGNLVTTSAPTRFSLFEQNVTSSGAKYYLYIDPTYATDATYYKYVASTCTQAYKYQKFGGEWTNCTVDNTTTAGNQMIIRNNDATSGGVGTDRIYLAEVFSGKKEAISFYGNTLNAAPTLFGTMNFVSGAAGASPADDTMLKSGSSKMEFDPQISQLIFPSASMAAAVTALKTYLAAKSYVSTWTE